MDALLGVLQYLGLAVGILYGLIATILFVVIFSDVIVTGKFYDGSRMGILATRIPLTLLIAICSALWLVIFVVRPRAKRSAEAYHN